MTKSKLFCLLAVTALVCTLPASADVTMRVFDTVGNLQVNASLTAVCGNGDVVRLPANANGTFDLPVNPGDKVSIRMASPSNDYEPLHAVVPNPDGPTWDVIVVPQGPVANDECADAIPAVLGINSGTTLGATVSPEGGEFCDTSQGTGGDVWYSVTGNGNTLSASVCFNDGNGSADYDTKLTVWCLGCTGLQGEGPACVAGNDDSPNCGFPDFLSTVTWCSDPGAEYLIMVHGFGTAVGNFEMELTDLGPCAPTGDCVPPEPECGNGIVEPQVGEECDPPNGTTCDENCLLIPQGACCQFTCNDPCVETCFEGSEADCAAAGGSFLGDGTVCFEIGDTLNFAGAGALAIPDGGPGAAAGPVATQDIIVPGSVSIADINVNVVISHSWIGDLIFSITNPANQTIDLWVQACNNGQYSGIATAFDDEGTAAFCNPAGPTPDPTDGNGNIIPLGGTPLSVFDGQDAGGTWTFSINDNFANDTGSLDQWSLDITEGVAQCDNCGDVVDPGDEEDEEDDDGSTSVIDASGTNSDGLVHLEFNGNSVDQSETTAPDVTVEQNKARTSKSSGR